MEMFLAGAAQFTCGIGICILVLTCAVVVIWFVCVCVDKIGPGLVGAKHHRYRLPRAGYLTGFMFAMTMVFVTAMTVFVCVDNMFMAGCLSVPTLFLMTVTFLSSIRSRKVGKGR